MDKDEITAIHTKLNKLEKHLINLILPIQGITTVMRNSKSIAQMIELLGKPLSVDDRFFKNLLVEITQSVCEFKEASEKLDIVQTLSEIKYIGSRLNKIESDIADMKKDGIKRNVNLEFRCDGYELVKKPLGYEKDDPIVAPEQDLLSSVLDTLDERESKVLIHRFGLFGEKKKTFKEIAKLFGLQSGESMRRVQEIALRKLRNASRKEKVKLISNEELRKAVLGD
jgi:hypothetical protein